MERFLKALPKAELHVHVEGTLEPELMFAVARRNRVKLPFASAEEAKTAYRFEDLQSFLDIYYQGAAVLLTEEDFFDLAWAYFERAAAHNVRRVEMFFDPQTHTGRGVPLEAVVEGLYRAKVEAQRKFGISSGLILCFLRHLSAEAAASTLDEALPFRDKLLGVGLDSSEKGNPPRKFEAVFARARDAGLRATAHAGEEGPPEYIRQALDRLKAERIDHGVRCLEDPNLALRLAEERVPLTVCPLSNVKLRVFDRLEDHNLKALLERGLCVSLHSDDPAYFGGYIGDNYAAAQRVLGLDEDQLRSLAKNSFEASFLDPKDRARFQDEVDRCPGP